MSETEERRREALEAAVYRRLRDHLRARGDVQNIDLMNLAGFCRNCLANWYRDAAEAEGAPMDKEAAREIVYGMPYAEWQERNQRPASDEALARFSERGDGHD